MWVLLPVKQLAEAKQRLASVLTPVERSTFFQAMLNDILDVLLSSPLVKGVSLVAADPAFEKLAAQRGVEYLAEQDLGSTGLNESLRSAVSLLNERSTQNVLIMHADLPEFSTDDLEGMYASYQSLAKPALLVSPDQRRKGTNALLFSTKHCPSLQFGKNSFQKHKDQRQSFASLSVYDKSLGISRDIDYPEDLLEFIHSGSVSANSLARNFLMTKNIQQRLSSSDSMKLSDEQALALADNPDTAALTLQARQLRDQGFRNVISYSRKVFIPLTQLCRDVCHYCTFAQVPRKLEAAYLSVEEVIKRVRAAEEQGCKEVLLTLGERPEDRYRAAREALEELGFDSTLSYLTHVAEAILRETGLLPHINAGCMSSKEMQMLRPVSASMGIMLESASERLCQKGMPHYGSPDKQPARRLETIRLAGELNVPFTTGILIGIGETRLERIESLLALRALHEEYGHIQEIIIQNFRAKPDTQMAEAPEPDLNELLWTIAVARLIFGAEMSIQAPPNLSPGVLPQLVNAGLNDWGGVSPVTPDYVNPEAPWPHLEKLARETAIANKHLQERLTIYPSYVLNRQRWLDENLHTRILAMTDTEGYPRTDNWLAGTADAPSSLELEAVVKEVNVDKIDPKLKQIVERAVNAERLSETDVIRMFQSRGQEFSYVCQQANQLRETVNGSDVSYVVNRNINYTNVCYFKCQFCAFSKGKLSENLRGRPYDLDHDEIARRVREAKARGATEVCMQGGIHPGYDGNSYLKILDTVGEAASDIHIHAFSPLEVWQGAETLGISLAEYLKQLKDAGLKSLPGTAAEILDDEVRQEICPDKITTSQWFKVIDTAHQVGLRTTSTIMFGHVEGLQHWARHLLRLRDQQELSGGFTEFVPLPFVAAESPMYLKGNSRQGPTFRESMLMHAVARLVLNGQISNIQASWVKLGDEGVNAALEAGVNDLGGTLMNESISRAAGASHGQEKAAVSMREMVLEKGRTPVQRTTLYKSVDEEYLVPDADMIPLQEIVNTPLKRINN